MTDAKAEPKSNLALPSLSRLTHIVTGLGLLQQFAIAATLVLGVTMLLVGTWVSNQISSVLLDRTAEVGAIYMENALEPLVQELANGETLSREHIADIDALARSFAARAHVLSVKVWTPTGVIAYSGEKSMIGRKFETDEIKPALKGEVHGVLTTVIDDENVFESTLVFPVYEVFAPIYRKGTREIIAVGEFYEDSSHLVADIRMAVLDSWGIVGGATAAMLLLLCAIVYRGDRTITRQRHRLQRRYRQHLQMRAANEALQAETREALRMASQIDRKIQKRIGAELHDGPAQYLAFILLRLHAVEKLVATVPRTGLVGHSVFDQIRQSGSEALKEIRAISTGLFLPFIENNTDVTDVVGRIVSAHELRTGTDVSYRHTAMRPVYDADVMECVARVAQETLNNISKHADLADAYVHLSEDTQMFRLQVFDSGPGIGEISDVGDNSGHLGIAGMRYRVRSVGGKLTLRNRPSGGLEVLCELPFRKTA